MIASRIVSTSDEYFFYSDRRKSLHICKEVLRILSKTEELPESLRVTFSDEPMEAFRLELAAFGRVRIVGWCSTHFDVDKYFGVCRGERERLARLLKLTKAERHQWFYSVNAPHRTFYLKAEPFKLRKRKAKQ